MLALGIAVALAAAAWVVLLARHGGFWRTDQRLPDRSPGAAGMTAWPEVIAVVPARDEAAILPVTLPGLLAQDYPGPFSVTLVDDSSSDGTGEVAAAIGAGASRPLRIVHGAAPPAGWAGKPWAMAQGLTATRVLAGAPYVLFTDADIAWSPARSARWSPRPSSDDRDLASQMALLRTETGWEKTIIPAFVYFFAQLYPFRWVNRPGGRTAAAAGGCMLVRRRALDAAGGLAPIRGALIDDVALGRLLKRPPARGRCWLGLSTGVRSVRPYVGLADLWNMVARSAYTQLRYSPWLLAGTLAGLAWLYALPGQRPRGPDRSRGGRAADGGRRRDRSAAVRGRRRCRMGGDDGQLPADAPAVPAVTAAGPTAARHRHPLRGDDRRFGPSALRSAEAAPGKAARAGPTSAGNDIREEAHS